MITYDGDVSVSSVYFALGCAHPASCTTVEKQHKLLLWRLETTCNRFVGSKDVGIDTNLISYAKSQNISIFKLWCHASGTNVAKSGTSPPPNVLQVFLTCFSSQETPI